MKKNKERHIYRVLRIVSLLLLSSIYYGVAQPNFQKHLKAESSYIWIESIEAANENLLLIHGKVDSTISIDGMQLSKLDAFGNVLWSINYNFNHFNLIAADILHTTDQHIIVLAYIAYYPTNTSQNQSNQLAIMKFTSTGELVWDFILNRAQVSSDDIHSIVETTDGNYIVLVSNGIILKISADGHEIWEKRIGLLENYKHSRLLAMPDNSIIISGQSIAQDIMSGSFINTIITSIDEHGDMQWSKAIPDLLPWDLKLFSNHDILLTGTSTKAFQQPHLLKLSPNGLIRWVKIVPLINEWKHEHTLITNSNEIVTTFMTNQGSTLIQYNIEGEVLWSKVFLAARNSTETTKTTGGSIIAGLADGSIALLIRRFFNATQTLDEDVIIKTSKYGDLSNCYSANICLNTTSLALPTTVDVDVVVENMEIPNIRLDALNGWITSQELTTKDYCTKINIPSPFFTTPDTLCVNTLIEVDNLCQEEADFWRWQTAGETISTESNPQNMQLQTPGLHTLTHVISTNGCRDTFSQVVQVVAPSEFSIGQDTVLCENEPLVLDITHNHFEYYTWSDNHIGGKRTISESGIYTAFAEDNYCTVNASRKIDFIRDLYPNKPINLGSDTTICEQIPLQLNATHPDAKSYFWEDGSTDYFRNITKAGTYWIEVNIKDCYFEDEITIATEDCAGKLYMPTAFSPNNDGVNDLLEFGSKYVDITSIQIFNRWGVLVYEGNTAWDGRIKGVDAAEGIYVYKVKYLVPLLEKINSKTGEIMLVR